MKYIISFALLVGVVLGFSGQAVAAPDIGLGQNGLANTVGQKSGYSVGNDETALSQSVGRVIQIVLTMVGTIFLVLTVYAGFLWMTAGGNDEQVSKAKSIIQMATIGLIIVLASYTITTFVVARLIGATKGVVNTTTNSTNFTNF